MPASIGLARAGGTVGEWTSIIESETSGRYAVTLSFRADPGGSSPAPDHSPPLRIVLGKSGLDGHNNAVKLLALACRDAGMEVVYAGTKIPPDALVRTAVDEDADILAISSLSGAHMHLARRVLSLRSETPHARFKVVLGGIIPEADCQKLADMGIDLVVPNTAIPLGNIAEMMRKVARAG
jgi:methylmalonyl-CoA mutase C-terminal domain/subunit